MVDILVEEDTMYEIMQNITAEEVEEREEAEEAKEERLFCPETIHGTQRLCLTSVSCNQKASCVNTPDSCVLQMVTIWNIFMVAVLLYVTCV